MFRQVLEVYSQTYWKADPDHVADVFIIRIKQQVEAVREYAQDTSTKILDLKHWKGRAKIALKRLKYQARRDCDL